MATGFIFLQNGGFTLFPISGNPASRTEGDIWVDDADGLLMVYDGTTNQKMVSTGATQTLSNKTINNVIFTGTVTGLLKSDVGLGNVDNTSDATKNAAVATLTNKTIDSASNTITIDGDEATVEDLALTSLKTTLADASKFLVRDASGIVVSNTKAVPTGAVVGTSDSQTLTNKTLTTPVIAQISNTGTLTLPTSTDTLVGRDTTDTLTNKTLTSPTINSGTITTPTINDYQDINEESAPSTPSAGKIRLYGKTDKALYYKDSDGNEKLLATESPDTIELVQLRNFDYSGNFTTLIPQYPWESPTKLSDPDTIPTNTGITSAWSPNGEFLATGCTGTPVLNIYQRRGVSLVKLTDPGTLPTGSVRGIAWSPNGEFLACTHNSAPVITIYQRSGTTFTKLADPGTLPTGIGQSVDWSPNGEFLACAHGASPYLTMYRRSGTTFTKLTDPSTLPTSGGLNVKFRPDGLRVVVATSSTGLGPEIQMYSFSSTAVGTRVANVTPGYAINCLSFTNDGNKLAACGDFLDVLIYDIGETSITLDQTLTIPGSPSGKLMNSTAYALNGKYLFVANTGGDLVYTWSIDENIYTPLSALSGLTITSAYEVSISNNCEFLSIMGGGTPYINIYRTTGSMPATGLIKLLGI